MTGSGLPQRVQNFCPSLNAVPQFVQNAIVIPLSVIWKIRSDAPEAGAFCDGSVVSKDWSGYTDKVSDEMAMRIGVRRGSSAESENIALYLNLNIKIRKREDVFHKRQSDLIRNHPVRLSEVRYIGHRFCDNDIVRKL